MSLARLRAKGLAAPIHPAKSELPHTGRSDRTITTLPQGGAPDARHVPGRRSAMRPTTVAPGSDGAAARLASRADSVLVASATYKAFGPMTSMAFGNGTTQTMTYNQRYLPQENKLAANGRGVADHTVFRGRRR